MSTILDALRKSEQERNLNKLPTLSDIPAPQEQSRWPPILIIVLLVIILLLAIGFGGRWLLLEPHVADNSPALNNQTSGEASGNIAESNQPTNQQIVVNVVSYAQTPEKRFVMINGTLYRENDFVRPGLKVVSIKPDSVVLNERGRQIEKSP